jgi:conjugative transposon TraM protein
MKNIDFKKPKYVLPLIVFPFLFIFFYVFQSWGANSQKHALQAKEDSLSSVNTAQINSDIPGVSKEVAKGDIKDRFQSLREAYKNDKDYTALSTLEQEQQLGSGYASTYSKEDVERIKTNERFNNLTSSLNANRANLDRNMQKMLSQANGNSNYSRSNNYPDRSPQDIYNELEQQSSPYNSYSRNNKQKDEMAVFREQMRVVDSMQKASVQSALATPSGRKEKSYNQSAKDYNPSDDTSFKPLKVSTVPSRASGFNTIRAFKASENIKAIIDQAEKVTAGTRLRIRLLQEIVVGNHTIPEGTYVYGFVTGFQTQRVNISINQIMFQGQPLPVKLDVFDNDGYLGIYVPQSNFLEFTKQIGTQGTNGLSSIETSNGANEITSSLLSKIFTTTGSSVNKLIQKDKAFVKYNYIIYLQENTK